MSPCCNIIQSKFRPGPKDMFLHLKRMRKWKIVGGCACEAMLYDDIIFETWHCSINLHLHEYVHTTAYNNMMSTCLGPRLKRQHLSWFQFRFPCNGGWKILQEVRVAWATFAYLYQPCPLATLFWRCIIGVSTGIASVMYWAKIQGET